MKTTLTIMGIVFFKICILNAQDVKFKPSILSFRNERLSFGFGLESSGSGIMKFKGSPNDVKMKFDHPLDSSATPYFNYAIDFDLYSPNSIIGFYFPIGYSVNYFYINGKYNDQDFFNYKKLEFPVYLKIRTGQRNGNLHLWIALGGSYNYNLKVKRNYSSNYKILQYQDENKSQLKNTFSVGGLIGYEIVNFNKGNVESDINANMGKFRFVMFARFNYYFQNGINTDYNHFKKDSNKSAIGSYSDFNLKYFVTSFGIKLLFQPPKKLPK